MNHPAATLFAMLLGLTACSGNVTATDTAAKSHTYIVAMKENVERAAVSQLARDIVAKHGGFVVQVYEHSLVGFAATLTEAEARAIAGDPRVRYVERDSTVRAQEPPATK